MSDKKNRSSQNSYLNANLCKELREVINSTTIFSHDERYLTKFNLICAVMDRVDSCANKMNTYSDYPDSEEDFIVFLTFGCMVVDACKILLKELGIDCKEKNEYKFFKQYYENSDIFNKDAEIPTDDKFFEYFRALAFAHPFETSRPKFLKKGETQYSPWVIVNKNLSFLYNMKNAVGIRIYSSLSEKIFHVMMPFSVIKGYIKSKHEKIKLVTDWAKKEIDNTHTEWKNTKINRNQEPIAIFKEIKSILESRFQNTYSIEKIILYLECSLTAKENVANVEKFRNAIIALIPKVCDCVDSLDAEGMEEATYSVFMCPQNMHQQAHYQLEKIFDYLDERSDSIEPSSNEEWGLMQADLFAKEFAKKWVAINVQCMPYDEIKLLVSTACYLEAQEQKKESE